MMRFAPPVRARRRPSLTPMIDVVFLLLVFFMLASRFGGVEALPLPLASAGPAAAVADAPRLVDVTPLGVRLNGVAQGEDALAAAILSQGGGHEAIVVLRPRDGAPLQRIVDVATALKGAGFTRLALVE